MNRIDHERRTVEMMIRLYCRHKEGNSELCGGCAELLSYARQRLVPCEEIRKRAHVFEKRKGQLAAQCLDLINLRQQGLQLIEVPQFFLYGHVRRYFFFRRHVDTCYCCLFVVRGCQSVM